MQAISDTFKVLGHIRDIEEMLHDLIASLSQEADILKEILNDLDEVAKSDLDATVTCDVLPSCKMFYRCHGLMGYKEEMEKTNNKVAGNPWRLSSDRN